MRSLHYTRGVAMVLVVAAHVQSTLQALSPGTRLLDHAILVFLHGGAIGIFFCLAGFLFHHRLQQQHGKISNGENDNVLSPTLPLRQPYPSGIFVTETPFGNEFQFWRFLKSRLCRIGVPYLAISVPVVLRRMYLEQQLKLSISTESNTFFEVLSRIATKENLQSLLFQLCGGRDVIYAYWFIPVMLVLCLLSPFVVLFLRFTFTIQVSLVVLSILLSSLMINVPSGQAKLSVWHLFLYFWPVYLMGVMLSVHRSTILMVYLRNKGLHFSVCVIFCILCRIKILGTETTGALREHLLKILSVCQLVFTCLFALVVSQRFNERQARPPQLHHIVQFLADTSFEIYLIHPWILWKADVLMKEKNLKEPLLRMGLIVWVLETTVVLFFCASFILVWRTIQKSLNTMKYGMIRVLHLKKSDG